METQDRSHLLNKQLGKKDKTQKDSEQSFYLVVTHNPKNPVIREIVQTNWPILQKSKTTRDLHDAKIIFGLRRNKNLADHLVSASTKTIHDNNTNAGHNRCQRSNTCRYCPILNTTGKIKSHTNGKTFTSLKNVNCQSSNLIYVISCDNCGIQYVGQTKNRLLTRFQGHFNDIDHDRDTTVARHLNRCTSETMQNTKFTITIVSFIRSPPDSVVSKSQRDKEEKRWMRRLTTIMPSGLNLMD